MISNCKNCFELGHKCPKHKEKNKKALSRKELTEKTTKQIEKGRQRVL